MYIHATSINVPVRLRRPRVRPSHESIPCLSRCDNRGGSANNRSLKGLRRIKGFMWFVRQGMGFSSVRWCFVLRVRHRRGARRSTYTHSTRVPIMAACEHPQDCAVRETTGVEGRAMTLV